MASNYDGGSQYGDRPRQSQEQAQREPHLLNLKVLRASRPSFSHSKDIFRDETSTEQSASTSGFTLTPLLALPTAFGNINLGETFQGLIVAANDSPQELYDASLRIEIQTANSRTTLWESPPPEKDNPRILKPGDSLEAPMLRYEIKEPGLHALSCSVSYWAPTRNLSFTPQPGAGDKHMRNFRKLYKFQASNPLAVKTKIHTSKNTAAQLDEESERTVFLEVQIQNTSPEALFLEKLQLHPSEYQSVTDVSVLPKGQLQPGDLLQCLYIVKSEISHHRELLEKAKHPGGSLPIGKLDIRWRSQMGDPGHLTTSQLFRRLPQQTLRPAISPSPSMQSLRTGAEQQQTPEKAGPSSSRDQSPNPSPHLGSAAAFSPAVSPRAQQMEHQGSQMRGRDLNVTLAVLPFDTASVTAGQPFDVTFRLSVTSMMRNPLSRATTKTTRKLGLAVQHVIHSVDSREIAPAVAERARTSLESHAYTDATPLQSARASMETDRALPSIVLPHESFHPLQGQTVNLPPPRPLPPDHPFFYSMLPKTLPWVLPDPECKYYGNTLTRLEIIEVDHRVEQKVSHSPTGAQPVNQPNTRASLESTSTTDEIPLEEVMRAKSAKRTQSTEHRFRLQYICNTPGIFKLGGIRILLLEDQWHEEINSGESQVLEGLQPCTILEHMVVAEVRVEV